VKHHVPVRALKRRGLAAIELAFSLPLLAYMLVAGVDFARIFYFEMVLDGCARNGALYVQLTADDPTSAFASVLAAVLADANANGLTPAPTVAVGYSASSAGPFTQTTSVSPGYVQVTVSWTFQTLVQYPGIASETPMTRVCLMPVASATPDFK
jgi:hypothetical protein